MANASTATPSTSGISRYARGARGVTRRVTPSGEIRTRRSETCAATAAPAGTPSATSRTSSTPSDMSLGKNGMPVNGMLASEPRNAKNRPKPTAVPATAAAVDSTAAITEICRGVAPTRRIAAKRCSRRAALSRVAVPMKISTGNSSPPAITPRMRSTVVSGSAGALSPTLVSCFAWGSLATCVGGAADDDEQGVRRRQRRRADRAEVTSGVAVAELVGRVGGQQLLQRRRGVVLPGPRRRRDADRGGRARSGRGDVDPDDLLAVEVVLPRRPPQRVRVAAGRRAWGYIDAYRVSCALTALTPARVASSSPTPTATAAAMMTRRVSASRPPATARRSPKRIMTRSGPARSRARRGR